MDNSSKHHLNTEGCSSSESGWTMYLASPMQQDDDQCSYDVIENYHYPVSKDGQDSDDSMASDASSGPHHQHKQESYQDHAGKSTSKSSNSKSFNLFSTKSNKNKEKKKNDGDKNKRVTANKRNTK
ncbi:hypothetical protein M5689_007369 [Euphorbia peplus]|nr:hypothetical protein M5689_007369 [Euphorbia peplus]